MSQRTDPHGARYVWAMVKDKATLKVAPGLAKVPKGQGFFLIMLVVMASLGAAGISYYADTCCSWSPNHPLQLFGICEPPASMQNVGGIAYGVGAHQACVTTTQQTEQVNGQPQVVNVQTAAGYFEYLNGTKAP